MASSLWKKLPKHYVPKEKHLCCILAHLLLLLTILRLRVWLLEQLKNQARRIGLFTCMCKTCFSQLYLSLKVSAGPNTEAALKSSEVMDKDHEN